MTDFYLNSVSIKAFSNFEDSINLQLKLLVNLVYDLASINKNFSNWYINNTSNEKPPLEYKFPDKKALEYLFKLRKNDTFKSFLLWNGKVDNDLYAAISFNIINLSLSLQSTLTRLEIVEIFKIILKYIPCKYLYLSNSYFMDVRIFEHRQPISSICFISKILNKNDVPFLYEKIDIHNDLNTGSILIFDENLFDESDTMKKKLQENAIVLVELDLIPETELDPDFFNDVEF
jgi:hypothetical protein